MKDLNKLLYVSERDVDLLLLEELNVNHDFALWFYARATNQSTAGLEPHGTWHSVSDSQLGESDLVATYANGLAILIENKIDAPAQPDQALRYRKRGEAGCQEGHWRKFVTCIVAPEKYLQTNSQAALYDAQITYEQIQAWFKNADTARASYRAYVLNEAIEQNRRGYSPLADEVVTKFWLAYWELANSDFPELNMPHPGLKPANSDWPYFFPNQLGKEFDIVHKMAKGCVDLQIRGAVERLDEFRELGDRHGLIAVPAGKSAALRFELDAVDRYGSFGEQCITVRQALEAARSLIPVVEAIRNGV